MFERLDIRVAALIAAAALPAGASAQDLDLFSSPSLAPAFSMQDGVHGNIPKQQPAGTMQLGGQGSDVFDVKTVEVRPGELREEQAVGEYEQPLWTTFRRFPSTRVYLQTPPGGVQFEQWFEFRDKRGDDDSETRVRQEFEFGLGHRLQLDLYMRELHVRDGQDSSFEWAGYSAELRYALADWDEIFANPTLYFEYIFQDGDYDKIEPKLLFGGEITQAWHWGVNLIHERTLADYDDRVEELAASGSVSRTIVDSLFSVGATMTYSYESEPGAPERERTREWMVGPSFQFIPHPRAAINVEPLWALNDEGKRFKCFVVFSWHF